MLSFQRLHLVFFFLTLVTVSLTAQDTITIDSDFSEIKIHPVQVGVLVDYPDTFQLGDLRYMNFRIDTGSVEKSAEEVEYARYFRLIIRNVSYNPIDISLSRSIPDLLNVYVYDNSGTIIRSDKLNIRGLKLFGRIQVQPGKSRELFMELLKNDDNVFPGARNLQFRLFNYNHFLQQELPNRFIDALLIGLLLFSAILNLILGLILKRSSFISLFFYLLSLVLFSFSFLGFYDEFIMHTRINIPISLPSYFLTLILFLRVSKKYLQLEKHLPGWNTVTNVIMFFLIISIPYYYLTVYVKDLYNNFLAFSSLFFFVAAALLGLIESAILLQKEQKAKFFLIANLLVVISLAINIFLDNKYPVVVGSVIQGFIFTFGLAEEIKILDRQKLRFQQRYIKQLEVNLNLKDNLTAELEQKVNERTGELKHANEALREKNAIVEQQKELLEIRNKEIKDSIEYARRIQNASFPSRKILEEITRDYFIMYKPRDIVSGDFYWFGEVDDKIIIIVADCTGHGVPGAFMSMYGIAFLNEIINKEKIYQPHDILNLLRDKISSSLNRGDNEFETMDGMDMSVLTYDPVNSRILFAGANNAMYYMREGELSIIKADKMPVAYYQKMDPFIMEEISILKGDCIYLFTDGLIDQFGGDMGKKFLSKRLKDVISDISHLPMNDQHEKLEEAFSTWKGDYFQVDDVLMVGIRI
ncbi:MAG TPA: SpoIIE family protein phosphatase [Bacteroidales bacterium]|nr:SpoIIE family protein phosphatase [Bacteroidales bacterium]